MHLTLFNLMLARTHGGANTPVLHFLPSSPSGTTPPCHLVRLFLADCGNNNIWTEERKEFTKITHVDSVSDQFRYQARMNHAGSTLSFSLHNPKHIAYLFLLSAPSSFSMKSTGQSHHLYILPHATSIFFPPQPKQIPVGLYPGPSPNRCSLVQLKCQTQCFIASSFFECFKSHIRIE